jgi:cell wall-associated NlpC family hydrolase
MVNDLDGLKRGDLVFWNGHVGIMTDSETLLHANGHHMMTVAEPLKDAVERIARAYGQITSIKRLLVTASRGPQGLRAARRADASLCWRQHRRRWFQGRCRQRSAG